MAPPDMALDGVLASVERRGFRMAELALGHREDALDAVQDAMIAVLGDRDRPQSEWPALFFSVRRSRITDRHRRHTVRRRVL
ncbi:MAG: RNA polymerase sigma factor, partial [Silanimonas sp.]